MPLLVCSNRLYTAPSVADGASVVPPSVAWTYSSWVEVVAAADTAYVLAGIWAFNYVDSVDGSPNGRRTVEWEVGIGSAGAETVIARLKTIIGWQIENIGYYPFPIPIDSIPAGSRVAIRLRKSNGGTRPLPAGITFYKKPISGTLVTTTRVPQVTNPGATPTELTYGGSAWTNSAWQELISSTSSAIAVTGYFENLVLAGDAEIDIGVGGSGAEAPVTTLRVRRHSGRAGGYRQLPNPLQIGSGNRVSWRWRGSSGSIFGTQSIFGFNYVELPL